MPSLLLILNITYMVCSCTLLVTSLVIWTAFPGSAASATLDRWIGPLWFSTWIPAIAYQGSAAAERGKMPC